MKISENYKIAGWISVFYLFIVLLLGKLAWICFIYILLSFKNLLNKELDFHATNKYLTILIIVILGGYILPYLENPYIPVQITSNIILIFSLIKGISFIMLGIKIRLIPESLHGLKQSLFFISVISGILFASVGLFFYIPQTYLDSLHSFYFMSGLVLDTLFTLITGIVLIKASKNSIKK